MRQAFGAVIAKQLAITSTTQSAWSRFSPPFPIGEGIRAAL